MKILFIFGSLFQGGAEKQYFYIVKTLIEQGVQVRLLTFTNGEYWEGPIRKLGAEIVWVGKGRSRLAKLTRIMRVVMKERPDIVQSTHFFANLYAAISGRAARTISIGSVRSDLNRELNANGRAAGLLNLRTPHFLIANSRRALREAVAMGCPERRVFYLPNVVDTDQFRPVPTPFDQRIKILTVGRLIEVKRIDIFLCIISKLRVQDKIPVEGVIVGGGPEYANLKEYAQKMKLLPDYVRFLGKVDNPAPIYQDADIFVFTSLKEGTPNVLLEAMATGLPVVSSNVGGVIDLIENGKTGYLYEPGDITTAIELVTMLANNKRLRMRIGSNAREYICSKFDIGQLNNHLELLYQRVFSVGS